MTPLSNFEANSNYKDVTDPAITVRFKWRIQQALALPPTIRSASAWTTTPWTYPLTWACALGRSGLPMDQGCGQRRDLPHRRKPRRRLLQRRDGYEVQDRQGSELKGIAYEPLFPYFAGHEGGFRTHNDDYVTTSDGTGIVHLAPTVRMTSGFVTEKASTWWTPWTRRPATPRSFRISGAFLQGLRQRPDQAPEVRAVGAPGQLQHSYPFCWRTDTPSSTAPSTPGTCGSPTCATTHRQ